MANQQPNIITGQRAALILHGEGIANLDPDERQALAAKLANELGAKATVRLTEVEDRARLLPVAAEDNEPVAPFTMLIGPEDRPYQPHGWSRHLARARKADPALGSDRKLKMNLTHLYSTSQLRAPDSGRIGELIDVHTKGHRNVTGITFLHPQAFIDQPEQTAKALRDIGPKPVAQIGKFIAAVTKTLATKSTVR